MEANNALMGAQMPPRSRLMSAAALMIATTLFYMLTNSGAKILLDDLEWFQIMFVRGLGGALVLLFLVVVTGQQKTLKKVPKTSLPILFVRLCIDTLMFGAFLQSLMGLHLGSAAALVLIGPVLITFLSSIVLGENLNVFRILALLISILGGALVIHYGPARAQGEAVAWLMLSITCLCINAIVTRHYRERFQPLAYVLIFHIFLVLLTFPFVLRFGRPFDPDGFLLYLGVGGFGALGLWAFNMAIRYAEGTFLAPFYYMELVWAVLFDFILWTVVPSRGVMFGGMLIVLSGLGLQFFETRRLKTLFVS